MRGRSQGCVDSGKAFGFYSYYSGSKKKVIKWGSDMVWFSVLSQSGYCVEDCCLEPRVKAGAFVRNRSQQSRRAMMRAQAVAQFK